VSRSTDRPKPIADDDPVRWFARLERAFKEADFPLAAMARDRLYALGWKIEPTRSRLAPARQGGGQ
jgi:hypothetical protein